MKFSPILLLVCLNAFAQGGYQKFQSGNFIGLKDRDDKVVLQAVFDDLGWSNGFSEPSDETIGFKQGEKWGLSSLSGKEITPAIYHKLEPLFPGSYKVAIKGKFSNRYFFGAIDNKGKILLNLDLFDLQKVDHILIATKLEETKFLKGALSAQFKWLTPVQYRSIIKREQLLIAELMNGQYDIHDLLGKTLASDVDKLTEKRSYLIINKRGKLGRIDWDGQRVIPAEHKEINTDGDMVPFPTWQVDPDTENFTIQCDSLKRWNLEWLTFINGFFQLISADGKALSQAYEFIESGRHNVIARADGKLQWYALDVAGKVILETSDSIKIDGHYLIVKNKNLWQVYDRFGKRLTDKTFEAIRAKSQQFLGVKKHGYWAILDGIQNTLSPFRYDEVGQVKGATSIVKYINRWGVHHSSDGWVLPPDFDEIVFWNDHFIARKKDSYFLYDNTGFLRFKTIDQMIPSDDKLLLFNGDKYTVMGSRGVPLGNTDYHGVTKWENYFEMSGELTELVKQDGRKVLTYDDEIQDVLGFSEDLFLIKKNDHFGFVDTDGKLRIANRYDSAKIFSDGMAPIKLRGKWGFIDKAERLVIQPHYQKVSSFNEGLATYQLAWKYGFINRSGQEVSKPIYPFIERTEFGNYILKDEHNRFGFSDKSGIVSISPSYEEIHDLGKNRLWTKRDGKVGLLDYSGRQILGFEYDEIQVINSHLLLRKD